jgi:hypothetical protein
MVVKDHEHVAHEFLIESLCLTARRVEDDLGATTGASFLLCRLQPLGAIALSS